MPVSLELIRQLYGILAPKAKAESFDDLRFNHQGNQVTGFVSTATQ